MLRGAGSLTRPGRSDQRLLGERPLGTEVADPHFRGRLARVLAGLLVEGKPDRFELLRRELELGLALPDLLGVEPGLVPVVDRGQYEAGLVGIQQRDRGGLAS